MLNTQWFPGSYNLRSVCNVVLLPKWARGGVVHESQESFCQYLHCTAEEIRVGESETSQRSCEEGQSWKQNPLCLLSPPQIHLLHRTSPVVQTLCTRCGPGFSTHMTGFDSLDCPVFLAPQYSTVQFLPLPHQVPVAKALAWDLCPDELSHQWWRRWRREGEIYHPAPRRTSDALLRILQGSTPLPHDLPILK